MARTAKSTPRPSALEWAAATIGLIVVLAALGVLAWQGVSGGSTPPDIMVRPAGVERAGAVWRLDLEASNAGERTAQDVVIEGRLGDETAQVTLDYLPGHGRREVSLVFTQRPDAAELHVLGWVDP
jgi:uncharacterized protein (TIGR02588 family)